MNTELEEICDCIIRINFGFIPPIYLAKELVMTIYKLDFPMFNIKLYPSYVTFYSSVGYYEEDEILNELNTFYSRHNITPFIPSISAVKC